MDRFEPNAEASERRAFEALLNFVIVAFPELLSRKSVPGTSVLRPRPVALKVTPGMLRVDLPVSLKISLRLSPFSRLMPLKDASWAVVLICVMMLLYWLTRFARIVCDAGSTTGGATAPKVKVPVPAPG